MNPWSCEGEMPDTDQGATADVSDGEMFASDNENIGSGDDIFASDGVSMEDGDDSSVGSEGSSTCTDEQSIAENSPAQQSGSPLVLQTQLDDEPTLHSQDEMSPPLTTRTVPETPLQRDATHNENFIAGTQLDFGGSDGEEVDSDATTDGQGDEFSGTYTRTQRRHLQAALEQSLAMSQEPKNPAPVQEVVHTVPPTTLRRSPSLSTPRTNESETSSLHSATRSVISRHLTAPKTASKRSGTQLSIASFLCSAKSKSDAAAKVANSQESPVIVSGTSVQKAKNTANVSTTPVLLPPGSVIDIHEARSLQAQMKNHREFMNDSENMDYMWMVFGTERLNQLKAILQAEDSIIKYIGEKLRVYDMICLLSSGFVSEEVLYYYQKVLEQGLPTVKFLSPNTFTYLQQFGYDSCTDLRRGDWGSITHCFWPVNCTPTHWTCAVHPMT